MTQQHVRSSAAMARRKQHQDRMQLKREQKREAKRYVLQFSFHDNIVKETVNTLLPAQIEAHLIQTFSGQGVWCECTFVDGEVLEDSLGRGTLQNHEPSVEELQRWHQ